MDVETLGIALAQIKKNKLPETTSSDQGSVMVVDANGKWAKGEIVDKTITVSGHKLVISSN